MEIKGLLVKAQGLNIKKTKNIIDGTSIEVVLVAQRLTINHHLKLQ